jgi:hypothetical protein
MANGELITAAVVLSLAIVTAWYVSSSTVEENAFANRKLLQKDMDLPIIWLYVDTSYVNSRLWSDFMARSSRAINLPFLNLCFESIVRQNQGLYRVEVIGGLSDLAVRLGGWEELPTPLQSAIAPVGQAELNWIRATVLSRFGGLWVEPNCIALKSFGKLPSDKIVFFGTDDQETYSGALGTKAPSLRVIWSPKPDHPLFIQWEGQAKRRLESGGTGKQFRNDAVSDVLDFADQYKKEVAYRPLAELRRKPSGKLIELDDLMMAGQEGDLPFILTKESVYVPIPLAELLSRREYGWFTRMSEEQILESDLVVSSLFRNVLPSPKGM